MITRSEVAWYDSKVFEPFYSPQWTAERTYQYLDGQNRLAFAQLQDLGAYHVEHISIALNTADNFRARPVRLMHGIG